MSTPEGVRPRQKLEPSHPKLRIAAQSPCRLGGGQTRAIAHAQGSSPRLIFGHRLCPRGTGICRYCRVRRARTALPSVSFGVTCSNSQRTTDGDRSLPDLQIVDPPGMTGGLPVAPPWNGLVAVGIRPDRDGVHGSPSLRVCPILWRPMAVARVNTIPGGPNRSNA